MRRRGRRRDAVRVAVAARRRDLLLRAQRPRARQRPARRPPLLHGVPRLPAPDRRREPAPSATPPARPDPPRGQEPGADRAQRPPHPASSGEDDAALRAADDPRAPRCGTRRNPDQAARSRGPASRRADVRGLAACAPPVRERDRHALEPDRAPHSQPPRRPGVARRRGEGVPHGAARQRRGLRHRRSRRPVPQAPRGARRRCARAKPAAGS